VFEDFSGARNMTFQGVRKDGHADDSVTGETMPNVNGQENDASHRPEHNLKRIERLEKLFSRYESGELEALSEAKASKHYVRFLSILLAIVLFVVGILWGYDLYLRH